MKTRKAISIKNQSINKNVEISLARHDEILGVKIPKITAFCLHHQSMIKVNLYFYVKSWVHLGPFTIFRQNKNPIFKKYSKLKNRPIQDFKNCLELRVKSKNHLVDRNALRRLSKPISRGIDL